MTDPAPEPAGAAGAPDPYVFFLSYARVPPTEDGAKAPTPTRTWSPSTANCAGTSCS